jgi:hypothetical protein
VKVMRGVPSNAKRQVALARAEVPPLTQISLPRGQDLALFERSPPLRTLLLVVALPTPPRNLSA